MKKNYMIHFIAFLSILLLPIIALAAYSNPYNEYMVKPLEKIIPNGEFSVYVLENGKWHEIGKLTYDKYFREREIDLSKYLSSDEKVYIRLQQKGGGAAHIDSIFLGGNPPIEVKDVQNGLKKLSRKDFDVIDAFQKNVEIVFNGIKKEKNLQLTARVEDIVNKGIPFQFPLQNLSRTINRDSHFYTYKLNSRRGGIELDGVLNEVANKLPFFKEYSLSGTGHPSNFTYGWVWNDDQNLYVAIDFTGDNTIDGDKDYAKVYLKTDTDIKEFKVSVPDTRWGNPGFSYTNKVDYQHKVYEFKIPLKELETLNINNNDELLLAFSAYGTNGSGQIGDFVWDDLNGNGLQDVGEPGIGGVTVELWRCSAGNPNLFLSSTTTNGAGAYLFSDLEESWGYAVRFILPSGYGFTLRNQGADDTIDSDADTSTGYTRCVNTDDLTLDGGLQKFEIIPTMTQWGMIIFLVLAGLGGVYYLRRQKTAKS